MTMLDPNPATRRRQRPRQPRQPANRVRNEVKYLRKATKPSRQEVLIAIMAEAGCSRSQAKRLLTFIEDACRRMRKHGERHLHLTQEEIDSIHHTLEAVMPDDTAPKEGSAHEKIDRYVLVDDEITLRHTKMGDYAINCAVVLHKTRLN